MEVLYSIAQRMGIALLLGGGVAPVTIAGSLAQITAALPDVPAPPQGEVQWVASSMRMNGVAMTLKTFQSRLDPEGVFNYYEAQARRWGRNEFRRSLRRDRRVLNIRSDSYYITIEARASIAGSEGTITVSEDPAQAKAVLTSRFPHPRTARVLNRQEYDDSGIESEHLSLSSTRSVGIEAQAFVEELMRAGWVIVRHQPTQTRSRGVVIEAQCGAEQAQLTLQPDQSGLATTAIVVIWRKS